MSPSERISKVIEYAELSPSEFADAIDVQRSSISHITSGRNKPSLDFLIKVRQHFPELAWDWLILGEGDMLSPTTKVEEKQAETPVKSTPENFHGGLFDLIGDELFGTTESEDRAAPQSYEIPQTEIPRESAISGERTEQVKISDSQPLELKPESSFPLPPLQNKKEPQIKRIVLFFDNGKFETYEP